MTAKTGNIAEVKQLGREVALGEQVLAWHFSEKLWRLNHEVWKFRSKKKNEEGREELQRNKNFTMLVFWPGMVSGHWEQVISALWLSQNLVCKSHPVHLEPYRLTSNPDEFLKLTVLSCLHLEIGTNSPRRATMSRMTPYM